MFDAADRREFLKLVSSSAGAAALTALPQRVLAAGDRIVVGILGAGGRGTYLAGEFQKVPGVQVAWVCDVDEERRNKAAAKLGIPSGRAAADLRTVLDDKSVDAVAIATPDHWHTPASILACDAGKHVYVEKPLSHNIREGRLLIEAVNRTGRLVQHGTQVRSTTMMVEAIRLLRSGIIGDVLVARCWNIQRRRNIGHRQPEVPPVFLNYDDWVGPAPFVPWQSNRCHGDWHWWYDFGTGDMGNDGIHDIEYARWGLGVETHPTRVVALGGKYHFDDDQQFADTQQVTFEFPGDGKPGSQRLLVYEQRLWSTNYPHNVDSGAEFYGTRGQMFLSRRGKIEVRGERGAPISVDVKPEPHNATTHVRNFSDAIRGEAKLNAGVALGHLSASQCHLGNAATRLKRSLVFDPQTEQIVGDTEANVLIARNYREHWGKPRAPA